MKAIYTRTLKDYTLKFPNWYVDLLSDYPLGDTTQKHNDRVGKLWETFYGMYWSMELCTDENSGEDEYWKFTFSEYFEGAYTTWYRYYKEKLDWYETQINMLDGIVSETTSNTTTKSIDLPRQNVSLSSTTPSSASLGDITSTTKGNISVIQLKKDYEGLIKNIYLEFARKFEKCFITLYS